MNHGETNDPDIHQSAIHRLADLIGLDETADWQQDDLAGLLRHQLQATIAGELADSDRAVTRRLGELTAAGTKGLDTLDQILQHPQPPLEYLQCIRRFGKQRGSGSPPLPREISAVIYLAAICAARLRLAERISEMDDATMKKRLDWAIAQEFLTSELRELFVETHQSLQ